MVKLTDLIKSTNIITVHPHETVSSAISKLSSSHDAGFVFSEEDKFQGVISPYYCLIKSSSPANAKVEHCLFHAPRIKTDFPLSKVAQLMMESKVHYLPVFNEQEKFIGIVSARRLLSSVKGLPIFKIKVKEILKNKKQRVITIYEDDFIDNALKMFKLYKISKLVVINRDRKLKGVLSYYDLISFLIAPKKKEHRGERSGNRIHFHHQQIRNFTKTYILTLDEEDSMEEALRLILEKRIGSVVIIDSQKHPIGIITTRDFLSLIIKDKEREKLEIISRDLSQENRRVLGGFFNGFSHQIKNIPNLMKAKLFVKEEKQGGVFKVNLSLIPKKGEPTVISREGKNLAKVLKKIKKE